jgi:hypothetical protein
VGGLVTGPEGDRLLRDALVRAAIKRASEPSSVWTPEAGIAVVIIATIVVVAVLWGVLW